MTRRALLFAVWTLPAALCLAVTAIVYAAFRIAPPARLDAAERTAVMASLRAALDGPAAAPDVHRPLAGPLVVTVWSGGKSVARFDAAGADLAQATLAAAQAMRGSLEVRALSPADRAAARLQVDIVTGTGRLGGGSWLVDHLAIPGIADMLPINPGVEGIGADVGGRPVLLLPHELAGYKLLAAKRPSEAMPDLAMGADLARIGQLLASRAGAAAPVAPAALYRFRTDSFVEPVDHAGAPLPLVRGLPPPPVLSARTLREAALRGGRYLVAHLAPNGRYVYEHDLWTGAASDAMRPGGAYSMPRHAGTTYFLAELYRITRESWLREPIERAFAHLADLLAGGGCAGVLPDGTAYDCVLDRGESTAHLGSTALAVVALAEYQRATDDHRYLALAQRLAAWLLTMQRADGSFRHLYDVKTRTPDETAELLYYSGEAALALARMHTITGEARYAAAAGRALDWLVGWYDFFVGGFFYGEEHWTCIAAEALWPAVQRDAYRAFCDGYGAFLRAQQAEPGDYPDEDDFAGAYNLTPFVVPFNTPAGSRTEAMISAYLLGVHHGAPDPRIAAQIRAALQYALRQQIRPDSDFDVVGQGDGAIPATPIDRNIRIDYVQHVCSAMLRASELPDAPP
ncbi:MAG: hypothetical protein E6J90_12325 [Deltaproteobacteria bacterium]|nr:MAG: hypothetical protein E6J90_12325 [Deltaproteobacteria bacterium]